MLISTALVGWQASAQPQDSSAGPAPASPGATGSDVGFGEILVTARKREERLIDVPVAITVFDNKQLERYGTNSLQNLSTQVPQVQITPSMGAAAGAIVTIRGFGSNASADNSIEQAVSFNIDGVSSARGRLITQALFDLSDVQILKGPQSLYFGKNSPAGVIVVTSAGPGDSLSGYAKAGYEFKAREYRVEGAVGGPITDTLGIRVAAYRSGMSRGYVKNLAGPVSAADNPVAYDNANGIALPGRGYRWGPEAKQTAGRVTLAFDPGSGFNATFKFIAADYKNNGDSSTQVNTSCPVGFNTVNQVDLGAILFTGAPGLVTDPYGVCGRDRRVNSVGSLPASVAATIPGARDGTPYLKSRSYLGSATLNYTTDELTFTSVSGYYRGRTYNLLNADNTVFMLIPSTTTEKVNSFSQELRVNSDFKGPVNFMAGAFYSNDKHDSPYLSGLIRAEDPIVGGNIYTTRGTTNGKGHSFALFGELRAELSPEIEITGGARYTEELKKGLLRNDYVQPGLATALNLTLAQGVEVRGRVKQSNVSPQATITWKPVSNVSVYGAYRSAFKSGGVSHPGLIPANADPDNVTYDQEKVTGYEAGIKFEAFDRRLSGEIAIYDYTYKGLQVAAFNSDTGTISIQNAGGAEARGVEGNANFRAAEGLTLRSSFGYNRARYTSFPGSQCWDGQTAAQGCVGGISQNLTGQPLPRAPKWVLSGGFDYDTPVSGNMNIGFSFDAKYSDGYFTTPQLNPFAYQGNFTTLDASIRLHDVDDKWSLSLIGRNLTDKFYLVVSADKPLALSPGSVYSELGLPRTIALEATYRF